MMTVKSEANTVPHCFNYAQSHAHFIEKASTNK
uniref:Uncharacterized protein n=1 Tax=Anguilla anguilla TaxID=7936 RepID=A0A0E9QSN2_ANGAN